MDIETFNHEVDRLADAFLFRQVSLFLGAGVSINAGLPSWKQLLDILASDLDLPAFDRAALAQLNPLEAASVLADRAGGEARLKVRCAEVIGAAKRHSLMHALLAGLPFKGCVTTNFDELFELAVIGAGAEMAVLPADIGSVQVGHTGWGCAIRSVSVLSAVLVFYVWCCWRAMLSLVMQ